VKRGISFQRLFSRFLVLARLGKKPPGKYSEEKDSIASRQIVSVLRFRYIKGTVYRDQKASMKLFSNRSRKND
jgi:hypothetical protein